MGVGAHSAQPTQLQQTFDAKCFQFSTFVVKLQVSRHPPVIDYSNVAQVAVSSTTHNRAKGDGECTCKHYVILTDR